MSTRNRGNRKQEEYETDEEYLEEYIAPLPPSSLGVDPSQVEKRSPPRQQASSQRSKGLDDLAEFENDDTLMTVTVLSFVAQNSSFVLPVSLVVSREQEMRTAAKRFGIGQERWSGSLLARKLRERLIEKEMEKLGKQLEEINGWSLTRPSNQMTSPMTQVMQQLSRCVPDDMEVDETGGRNVDTFVVNLDPESECSSSGQPLAWDPVLTSCIRSFYNTGTIRVPDECAGNDVLLALEYFGIVYAPDQLVFDSFGCYLRVKLWSDYYTHRSAMADWVVRRLMGAHSRHSHAFVTSPEPLQGGLYVGTKKCELFDGGLLLEASRYEAEGAAVPHSCSVVHEFFNDDDNLRIPTSGSLASSTTGSTMTNSEYLDSLLRRDFRCYLQNALPGTAVAFSLKAVSNAPCSGLPSETSLIGTRAFLHVDFHAKGKQNKHHNSHIQSLIEVKEGEGTVVSELDVDLASLNTSENKSPASKLVDASTAPGPNPASPNKDELSTSSAKSVTSNKSEVSKKSSPLAVVEEEKELENSKKDDATTETNTGTNVPLKHVKVGTNYGFDTQSDASPLSTPFQDEDREKSDVHISIQSPGLQTERDGVPPTSPLPPTSPALASSPQNIGVVKEDRGALNTISEALGFASVPLTGSKSGDVVNDETVPTSPKSEGTKDSVGEILESFGNSLTDFLFGEPPKTQPDIVTPRALPSNPSSPGVADVETKKTDPNQTASTQSFPSEGGFPTQQHETGLHPVNSFPNKDETCMVRNEHAPHAQLQTQETNFYLDETNAAWLRNVFTSSTMNASYWLGADNTLDTCAYTKDMLSDGLEAARQMGANATGDVEQKSSPDIPIQTQDEESPLQGKVVTTAPTNPSIPVQMSAVSHMEETYEEQGYGLVPAIKDDLPSPPPTPVQTSVATSDDHGSEQRAVSPTPLSWEDDEMTMDSALGSQCGVEVRPRGRKRTPDRATSPRPPRSPIVSPIRPPRSPIVSRNPAPSPGRRLQGFISIRKNRRHEM